MQKKTAGKQWFLKIAGLLFLGVTFIIVYLGNDAMPIMMDDNWYATRLFDEQPVRSLSDVIAAQTWHYFNWGGRSIAHGVLQLVLMTGSRGSDTINMIFNILFLAVVCKITKAKGALWISLIWGLIYGLNANWKESLCWQSGAANYLYMTTFILFFLLCYIRVLEGKQKALPFAAVWMMPLGLISGWSNENMGPTAWLLSLGIIVYLWVKEHNWQWWMLIGNISCLAGSVLVIIAPGNFVRNSEITNDKGLLWRVFLRCYSESKAIFEYLSPTLLVLACILLIAVGICKIKLSGADIVWLAGALLSWGAMILSPHYPDRATFGTMAFMICVIVSLAVKVLRQRAELKPWIFAAGSVIWFRGMFFVMEYTFIVWGWIK